MRSRGLDAPRSSPTRRARHGDGTRRLLETVPIPQESFRFHFPPLCQDALRRAAGLPVKSPQLDRALAALKRLDEQHPTWQHRAVSLLASSADSQPPLLRRAAVLLALRPLRRPDALLESLGRARHDALLADRLLALINTDTTATLPVWHRILIRRCEQPNRLDPVLFLCFVKCLQHRLMDHTLFERAAPAAISQANDNGRRSRPPYYHPVLDYLGLTDSGYFRLMYNSLLNSLVFDDPACAWEQVAWARRFPGERFLLAALQRLAREPTSAAALHIARWTYDLESTRAAFGSRLGAFRPAIVMLLSIVRRDMDALVASALGESNHAKAARWLRQGPFVAFRQAGAPGPLQAWCVRWGPAWEEALALVRRVHTPEGAEPVEFASQHLAPDLPRLIENLSFVWSLSGTRPDQLRHRARTGSQAAALALALSNVPVDEAAALLHSARLRATQPQARAIETALAHLSGQRTASLQVRPSVRAKAPDEPDLRGHEAMVWPDVAGWTIKLSVALGEPELLAYGPNGRADRIPAEARRHHRFQEIRQAHACLLRQHRQFRRLLEQAMVSQHQFTADEFSALRENALFAAMTDRLVLECDGDFSLGMPPASGKPVRLAHPVTLLQRGVLAHWQQRLSASGATQPFKQCFREFYLPQDSELHELRCPRFAGHQVLARSAFALLRTRGWTPGSGCAHRDWPRQRIRARLVWADGIASVGKYLMGPGHLQPVVTGPLYFRPLGTDGSESAEDLPIGQVDPVVFSEAMRDADLLVARAAAPDMGRDHRQARAFRADLLRRFASEHGLTNVVIGADDTYAIVEAAGGCYRVHLGSGSVFTEPEGRHVPAPGATPAQGLLPLDESDSRTARIVATVLSLAAVHR